MASQKITPVTLSIFKNLFAAICEEMGVVLARSAFSPNIKERKDFSCALFDRHGCLIAQAAHIPVHLGSMPLSVEAALQSFTLKPGDSVILNDPYRGGTHLPDITMVSPVFTQKNKQPAFYIANRAHHADIGGQSPGSMPLATHIKHEGVVIPPTLFYKQGRLQKAFLRGLLQQVRHPEERTADLQAQQAAIAVGVKRLVALVDQYGQRFILQTMKATRHYERKITEQAIQKIPNGTYHFEDVMEDDGQGEGPIPIHITLQVKKNSIDVDLRYSAPQVKGPINAPYAVTLSAIAYVFRCLVLALMGEDCLSLEPIHIKSKGGTVVDARYPAPVAGGNVETSQRIVDILFGALAPALPRIIPAASQGTMNNLACGNEHFGYYETLAGGMGARPDRNGIDAIHTHMTNTMNTPIEALEKALPLRVTQYHIRKNSGGRGRYKGGNGLVREYEFCEDVRVSLLTERRSTAPYGLKRGQPGKPGVNWHVTKQGRKKLPAKVELDVKSSERIRIETPGGGGFGRARGCR